jgi:septal ring factor EnvC (AmiA/AmiB activator)
MRSLAPMRRRLILPIVAVLAAAACLTAYAAETGDIASVQNQLAALGRRQVAAQARQGPERARLEMLDAQEQTLRLAMDRNRDQLGRLLSALQLYSKDPPPALLVSPRSANDAVRAAILMRAVTPELERRAAALKLQADGYQRVRRALVLAQATTIAAESEAAERKAQIEQLTAERAALAARPGGAAAEQTAALGGLVAGVTSQEPAGPATLADPGHLDAPVQGVRLAASPGNAGVSWRAAPNGQVWAPASGRVEYAGPLKGWGQVVVISLGGDWRVVLAGLDRVAVRAGAQVSAGQGVGLMGAQAAPRLYMELRKGNETADPARRLDAAQRP